MNKKIFLLHVLFFVSIIILLFCISCANNNDYVFNEFSWLLSKKNFLKHPSGCEKNWYLIYNLNIEQLDDMLEDDFKDYDYQGWECYRGNISIGNKKSIRINGNSNNVIMNQKKGGDSYNKIVMFIDLTEKKLILFYGITYGI